MRTARTFGGGSPGPLTPSFNLDGRVEKIARVRIAGLGAIFREKIWLPPAEAAYRSYHEFDQRVARSWWTEDERRQRRQWLANQRLTHRATIFPEVYERLQNLAADVLVTHEAPRGNGMHPYGFAAINEIADPRGVPRPSSRGGTLPFSRRRMPVGERRYAADRRPPRKSGGMRPSYR